MSSVVRSKRGESQQLFLTTAREIQKEAIIFATNVIPKRYNFHVGTRITSAGYNIYSSLKKANSIYPTNMHEFQMRRDLMISAMIEMQNLVSQLELAQEIVGFKPRRMEKLCELINAELTLVSGLMKSDKRRINKAK